MGMLTIKHPEYLHIHDGDNIYMGAHQEWYEKMWQKRAGCGPTTASMVISYLFSKSYEQSVYIEKSDFLELMNEIWFFVTPGYRGVNSTSIFIRGCHEFAQKNNFDIEIQHLNVLPDKRLRPTKQEVSDFIAKSILNDSPVAFLNLHNGEEKNLDRWHWVLLVSFDPDDGTALMYDQGESKYINVFLWLNTTVFGGGLVTVERKV